MDGAQLGADVPQPRFGTEVNTRQGATWVVLFSACLAGCFGGG